MKSSLILKYPPFMHFITLIAVHFVSFTSLCVFAKPLNSYAPNNDKKTYSIELSKTFQIHWKKELLLKTTLMPSLQGYLLEGNQTSIWVSRKSTDHLPTPLFIQSEWEKTKSQLGGNLVDQGCKRLKGARFECKLERTKGIRRYNETYIWNEAHEFVLIQVQSPVEQDENKTASLPPVTYSFLGANP